MKWGAIGKSETVETNVEDIHTFVHRLERDERAAFALVASLDTNLEASISRYKRMDSRYKRMDERINEIRKYMRGHVGTGNSVNRQLWVAVKDCGSPYEKTRIRAEAEAVYRDSKRRARGNGRKPSTRRKYMGVPPRP